MQSAAGNNALNKTTEITSALIEAQNEKMAILAQIEGKFRSEQLINTNSLLNERNELDKEYFDLLEEEEQAEREKDV